MTFGIGEEFDEHTAAVVATECKTGDPVFITCFIQDLYKAPVHLESFPRLRLIPLPTAALRLYNMPLCRDKIQGSCTVFRHTVITNIISSPRQNACSCRGLSISSLFLFWQACGRKCSAGTSQAHVQISFPFPEPISKWYFTMPRSILV